MPPPDLSALSDDQLLQMLQTASAPTPAPAPAPPPQPSPMQRRMGVGHQGNTAGQIATAVDQAPYNLGGWATDKASQMGASPELAAGIGAAGILAPHIATMGVGGAAADLVKSAPQAMGKWLMQKAVSPTLDSLKSGEAARAIETMLKEGISPTIGGMEKLQGKISTLNDQVKAAIASSSETVNKGEVGKRLFDTWEKFKSQVNPQGDLAAIKQAWMDFRNHPDLQGVTDIPVQLAQKLKTGTYRSLGEKTYGELGTASTETQKAIARGLREEISKKVPSVAEPLAKESDLLNVLTVAERRALQEGNKNVTGLSLLAHNPLAFMGMMADRSAAVKAALARMLYSGPKPVGQAAGSAALQGEER